MSAVAALWLTACGGGGGDGPVAEAPAPAAAVRITGLTQQAEPNMAYTVAATGTDTVVITLPPAPQIGDTVSVTGESANSWRLAQNAGQTVLTSGMSGNVAPGTVWIERLAPKQWHWVKSNAAGDVLVATNIFGDLNVSRDGGQTWHAGGTATNNSPAGFAWISADMTPSGDRIVAVAYQGDMYMSTDRGVTWTQLRSADPAINLEDREFESITISNDGQRIAAVSLTDNARTGPGEIYVSQDAGTTWTVGTSDGTPLRRGWRAVDSSADGSILVAVSQRGGGTDGQVYVSTDAGATWTARNVAIDGVPVVEGWYRVAMSADGSIIAVGGNSVYAGSTGTGLYISRDLTWTLTTAPTADYTSIVMSPDGQVIGATISNGTAGSVQLSRNGGTTFTALTMPGSDTNWRAMGMSADGNKLVVAAGTFLKTTGQLYTSLGNRTEMGALGSITGGQGQTAELEYLGNGQFRVRSSGGGAFTIQ